MSYITRTVTLVTWRDGLHSRNTPLKAQEKCKGWCKANAVINRVQYNNNNIYLPSAKIVYNSNKDKKRHKKNFYNVSGVSLIDPTTKNLLTSSDGHILNNVTPPPPRLH